ncbi:hypothetical protein [Amycolatopsis sp. GA6-003]
MRAWASAVTAALAHGFRSRVFLRPGKAAVETGRTSTGDEH